MDQRFQFSLGRLMVAILAAALLAAIFLSQSRSRHGETGDAASLSDQPAAASGGVGSSPEEPQPKNAEDESERAVRVAREYIEQQSRTPIEATYTAQKTSDGYRVSVVYVRAFDEQGQPRPVTGGHCVLEISGDWRVTGVVLGR